MDTGRVHQGRRQRVERPRGEEPRLGAHAYAWAVRGAAAEGAERHRVVRRWQPEVVAGRRGRREEVEAVRRRDGEGRELISERRRRAGLTVHFKVSVSEIGRSAPGRRRARTSVPGLRCSTTTGIREGQYEGEEAWVGTRGVRTGEAVGEVRA